MRSIIKIALRNLIRYKRRTILTMSLISIGVVFVVIYIAVSGSFKSLIIGQITDSMLGHAEIHKKGFVASIDTLPLNLTMNMKETDAIEDILKKQKAVEAYSPRVKLGGMLSNYTETTNIRLNGVYPEKEFKTTPLLPKRITEGKPSLNRGEILVPELLAQGMKIKPGSEVVIVATNRDGSVNGMQFTVSGILSSVVGTGGRDGYINFDDAVELLRMEKPEVSEIAIRLKAFSKLTDFEKEMKKAIAGLPGGKPGLAEGKPKLPGGAGKSGLAGGKPVYEFHTWEGLSPFANIAKMVDVMTFFIRMMLIAIVLISIMNVMTMAVYERIREIGTVAAIGTKPGKILSMYLTEGFFLGAAGSVAGIVLGFIIITIINAAGVTFNFGRQEELVINASMGAVQSIVIILTVLIVSIAGGFYPAFKASRMEPVQALRHV